MDSSAIIPDKTLPVDFNESSNPDLLTEVTYGEVGIAPMMEKSSTGRMSPVRGRTMKEYDQQISVLKKENFDLKLRIYFMQERMNTKYNDETVIQTNIELNVEMEKYKQDLIDKQALLEKASETIDNLTTKYSEHVEKEVTHIKQQCDEAVEKANQKVAEMEKEMIAMEEQLHELEDECNSHLRPDLEAKDKQIQNLQANLEDRDRDIVELEDRINDLKREVTELRSNKEKQQLQFMDEMETLRTNLGRKDRDIKRLSVIVQDKTAVDGVTALERSHLKDEVEDTRRDLAKLRQTCDKHTKDLEARGQMIGKLEDLLREKEKEKDGLKKALDEKTESYTRCKGVIAKIAKDAHDKGERVQALEQEVKCLQDGLAKAKEAALGSELQRQKAAEEIAELEQNLEKLARTLGKREGELENFKDLLEKAQKSLNMSEAAVESLQKQLENERCRCKRKIPGGSDDEDVQKLRQELADLHVQLADKDKQYQSKCAELDTVAQRLNINVTTQHDGNSQADMLNKILNELHGLKGAVQSERHLHIDINSHLPAESHLDGSNCSTSTHQHTQVPPEKHDIDVFHHQEFDNHHKFPVVGKNGSRIPVRRGTSTSSTTSVPDDNVEVNSSRQITELKAQVQSLQNTLKATEQTVHCQTQKMKNYRNMLIENGLLPRSRSNSVPSGLNKLNSSLPMDYKFNNSQELSVGNSVDRSPRCRSVSPTPVTRCQNMEKVDVTDDTDNLNKENAKLKEQLDGYKRILKVFQGRSPSPGWEADNIRHDVGPAPISSESASCLLESWLNMLDNFLTDLSHSDQEGQVHLPTSSMEVARLRRGLVQARGAIQSLSDSCLAAQEKLSEGRLSPDSGCSDNPLSAHNTMKESPQNSPRVNGKSPLLSPRSNSSSVASDAGSRFDKFDGNGHIETSTQSRLVQGCDNMEKFRLSTSNESGDTRNRSPSEISSNLSYSGRDAGVDPRLSVHSDFQSMEKLRHCSEFTEPKNFSLNSYSGLDRSAFSTAGVESHADDTLRKTEIPVSHTRTQDGALQSESGNTSQRKTGHADVLAKFERTFSQSFLSGDDTFGDITTNVGRPSLIRFDDKSLLDLTIDNVHNKTSTAELQERMKSLEDIIRTYEEQIHQQPRPSMDSLQEHLNELRNLRILLEESMARNEQLEKLLFELKASSENTIQDLKFQLNQSNTVIQLKEKIIIEKEKLIKETNASLGKYRDNSAKDSADLEFCRERVKSLEKEIQTGRTTSDQLTAMCQQLKTAAEQYKKRCEQLEGDNKSHMDAVYRHKNRVKDLEEELKLKSEEGSNVEELKSQIEVLESEARLWRENESKYSIMLTQSKSQISQLSSDLDEARNELNLQQHDISFLKEQLEHSRDTVEEQNQHLCDKTCVIDRLNADMKEKDSILQEQDSLCRDLTTKMESLTTVNGKLLTQLEQQRLTCADYKCQIDKQSLLLKDLKDRAEKLREELSRSVEDRKSQDTLMTERQKELQEATRLRDKYLYNLKVTYKEFSKVKKDLKQAQKKCDETVSLNNTLQTELSVRERLMDEKGVMLTDDDKHNMIAELLKELKLARVQLTKVLEQNESLKERMTELIQQMKDRQSGQGTSSQFSDVALEIHTNKSFNSETSDLSIGGNQTWPLSNDLMDGVGRMDVFSASLPLRESTPGGPCSKSQQQTRMSSLPSQLSEQKDGRSEYNRFTDGESVETNYTETSKSKLMMEDVGISSGHFSVPGPIYKQRITDQCLLYNVNDSPKYLAGLTQVTIDSDVRSLFAVGMIDHFEKLRKEANECNVILKGLSTRVAERLKVFTKMSATEMIKSVEYSTLKELSYAADNMRICIDSQLSMIGCFWTSELPAPNEKGEFVNQKLISQNAALRDEICSLRSKLGRDVGGSQKQFEEEQLCKSLESTLEVMTRARQNLEYQQQHSLNST